MTLFIPQEAEYFCRPIGGTPPSAAASFKSWSDGLTNGQTLQESHVGFDDFRNLALCEIERLLLLAVSHYRRSVELLMPSSTGWAHVTMYYGYFFAAQALLGMFGIWSAKRGHSILMAVDGNAGSQKFAVSALTSTYRGTHQKFWDAFYTHISPLTTWIDISLRHALLANAGGVTWPADTRNRINYDSYEYCMLGSTMIQSFSKSNFPSSLPGDINTQFSMLESILVICSSYAKQFKLNSTGLSSLVIDPSRQRRFRRLVLSAKAPAIARKLDRRAIAG